MLQSLFKRYEEENQKDIPSRKVNMLVVGCGGGGTNSINRLKNMEMENITSIAMNTDSQHLNMIDADIKLLIGERLTHGHGTGGDPRLGKMCAEEARMEIRSILGKPDVVFVAVGLGGGTGTGSAPVVVDIAKTLGALVVAIVTMPFDYEGRRRSTNAEEGLGNLLRKADSVILLDNNKLLKLMPRLPLDVAFGFLDQLVASTINGMTEAVTKTSLINIDFADIKSILGKGGMSTILCGEGTLDDPSRVVSDTLQNSLLDIDVSGAEGAVIHITCDSKINLESINTIVRGITSRLSENANVIFGVRQDDDMQGTIRVLTVITGISIPAFSKKIPTKTPLPPRPRREENKRVLTLEEVFA